MRKLIDLLVGLAVAGSLLAVSVAPSPAQTPVVPGITSRPSNGNSQAFLPLTSPTQTPTAGSNIPHVSSSALAAALSVKTSSGSLYGFNCTAITGGSAGFCVAYNSATTPGAGALTGANVIDFCYFDTTARGCSLSRIPTSIVYSAGIVILVTSASTPYTYTTGTDTAAISADYQ